MKLLSTKEIFTLIQGLLKVSQINPNNIFIAGGCLRNVLNPKDIDIFARDEKSLYYLRDFLIKFGAKKICETENAITLEISQIEPKIQLIKKLTGNAEEVVNQFDFNINTNYLYFDQDFKTPNPPPAYLKVCDNVKTPLTLLSRTLKFTKKGFVIKKEELLKTLEIVKNALENEKKEDLNFKDLGNFYEI